MTPPGGGSPLDHKLWRAAGESFPSGWQEFGYWYLKHTVLAIRTIESEAPESSTDAVIQKFCNELRRHNVRQFVPFSLYMGGRYSILLDSCLQALVDCEVLSRRTSNHRDINQRVYELHSNYRDSVEHPPVWSDVFDTFRSHINLTNPFTDHYEQRVLRWISDESAYQWVTLETQLRDPSQLEEPADGQDHSDKSSVQAKIKSFDHPTRDAANLLYRLLRDYKSINEQEERLSRSAAVKQSRRRFSAKYLTDHYDEYGSEVVGEVVFIVGFFDMAEEAWRDPTSDTIYLREHIAAPESVKVNIPPNLDPTKDNLYQISAGVLGTTCEKNGELEVEPIAVLKSDDLSDELIEHQENKRVERRSQLAEERNELLTDLRDIVGDEHIGLSKEEVRANLEEAEEQETDDKKRSVYNRLLELIGVAAAEQGVGWVVEKAMEHYPEYALDILDAIGL
jgi:hypothetical protein